MCIISVKQNGLALRCIKNQTDELCLEAIKQNGYALEYVINQTYEMCILALSNSIFKVDWVNIKFNIKEKLNTIKDDNMKKKCEKWYRMKMRKNKM